MRTGINDGPLLPTPKEREVLEMPAHELVKQFTQAESIIDGLRVQRDALALKIAGLIEVLRDAAAFIDSIDYDDYAARESEDTLNAIWAAIAKAEEGTK